MLHHLSTAGDKILCPFEHDADLFQPGEVKRTASPRLQNPCRRTHADSGNPQQHFLRNCIDLNREKLRMGECPVAFGGRDKGQKTGALRQESHWR